MAKIYSSFQSQVHTSDHCKNAIMNNYGALQELRNADFYGGGGVQFSREKRYEGERFNVINITRGWVGGCPNSSEKALRNT